MILRCTNKLLAAIGPGRLDGQAPDPDPEDWYGNLMQVDGRACLLLTHAATLFTVLEAKAGTPALRNPHRLAASVIERELLAEGLPTTTFGDLRGEPLRLAKTADRRVLGCMNDMAFLCDHAAATDGGLAHTDLAAINRLLRHNINSTRGYQRPIDLTRERLHARGLPGYTTQHQDDQYLAAPAAPQPRHARPRDGAASGHGNGQPGGAPGNRAAGVHPT